MQSEFPYFVGIDWGSERHRVCLMERAGRIVEERWVEHSGNSLAELVDWLRRQTLESPSALAAAIEVPRGAIVETLLENGFVVFSINPKQLVRFRDRYSPAGAKDDRRDAFVLADSLRTDMHCFHAVRLDEPAMIRLRELSRLEDELSQEQNRTLNRLRGQLHRFFPQLLQLCEAADEPWLWTLFERAPFPAQAARLSEAKIARLLQQHRIRRLTAPEVRAVLKTKPLTLAPGAAQAAAEHALMLLPRLRLLHQQRTDLARRISSLLEELCTLHMSIPSIVTPLSFCPCRGWEEKSPPRCSARLRRPSRNEITMPCAAIAGPRPLLTRAAKRKSCSCARDAINVCATPFITGQG